MREAMFSTFDKEGKISFIDEKFSDVSKYAECELVGREHDVLANSNLSQDLIQSFRESINAGKVFNCVFKTSGKEGNCYWVDATIVPVKNKNGKIYKFLDVRYQISSSVAKYLYDMQLCKSDFELSN